MLCSHSPAGKEQLHIKAISVCQLASRLQMPAANQFKPCTSCNRISGETSRVELRRFSAVYLLSCRLLLEITAMRYGCVNHTTFSTCAADQSNWCTWHEEAGCCGMYYDDAEFVHLMMWSGTKVACAGVCH
jgi:hypothetical protein